MNSEKIFEACKDQEVREHLEWYAEAIADREPEEEILSGDFNQLANMSLEEFETSYRCWKIVSDICFAAYSILEENNRSQA